MKKIPVKIYLAVTAAFLCGFLAAGVIHLVKTRTPVTAPGLDRDAAGPGASRDDGGFRMAERVHYFRALEKIRYRLRAGPDAPPFEEAVSDERIEQSAIKQLREEALLRDHCNVVISDEMIRNEIDRMQDTYERMDVMLEIADALDRDPRAIVEFWVKPILVERYLRACAAADDDYNAGALARAQEKRDLLADGDTEGLETTRMEIRLTDDVDPEIREALAGSAPGRTSEVVELLEDFRVFRVESQNGGTVSVEVIAIKKPGFDQWLESRMR